MSAASVWTPASVDLSWRLCPVCDSPSAKTFVSFKQVASRAAAVAGTIYKSYEAIDLRPKEFYEQNYFQGPQVGARKALRASGEEMHAPNWLGTCFQPRQHLPRYRLLAWLRHGGGQRLGLEAAGSDISEYAVRTCRERGYRAEVGPLDRQPFRRRRVRFWS